MKYIAATFFALGIATSTTSSAQEICTGILSYTGRDISAEAQQNSTAESLYSSHCEGSSARKGSSTSVGLEAVVKAIPIKFSFGGATNEERLNNFCKVYNSNLALYNAQKKDSSIVVRKALDAFNTCVSLVGKGPQFAPQIGKTAIQVGIKRGDEEVYVDGVSYNHDALDCRFSAEDKKGPSVTADNDTVRKLDTSFINLRCERKAQDKAGVKVYPPTDLSISTNRGGIIIPIAEDAYQPLQWSTEIAAEIQQLRSALNVLQARKLSCNISTATDSKQYPVAVALVPDKEAVLTGGGCFISHHPETLHNGPIVENGPLSDRSGWRCKAGDPPNFAMTIRATAYAIYCKNT